MTLPPQASRRIASLDIVRGAVMVLMALDHVRVYSAIPAGGPTPGIFFTRWITHFVAPAFIFFAGTSAWLYGRSHADLPRFLVTRGLWLVLLELTVIRFAWTFNLDYGSYALAGVIWAIGWCMVLLAVLVRLPARVVGALGLAIILLHNLLDPRVPALGEWAGAHASGWVLKVLYLGFWAGPITVGSHLNLWVLYSIIPWIGVMAAGYGFGPVMAMEPARRRTLCLRLGGGAILVFLVLRGLNLYGDPVPWSAPAAGNPGAMPSLLSFLNTAKYPASLSFLLMTLGPAIALLPLAERHQDARVARWLETFGRVPFFYYLLHIPLIHLLAIGVSQLRLGHVSPWLFANHPIDVPTAPEGYRWGLGLLYLVWAASVVLLYWPCRWFARQKSGGRWKYL